MGAKLIGRDNLEFRGFYGAMFSTAFGNIGAGVALKFLPDFGASLKSAREIFKLMDEKSQIA